MKTFCRTLLFLLCIYTLPIFTQPSNQFIHQNVSDSGHPDSSIKRPDYRNHLNIPAYDPALMPLKSVRTGTGVWTELNPKVPRVNYTGLHFMNKDTGLACGGNGAIIKTTDGGKNWTISNTSVTNIILKIHSYNGELFIASGFDGIILRSTDKGQTFAQIASGVTTDLWRVQMINDTLGWICGTNWTLLKTTDAGLTWQSVTAGLNEHYWSIDFLNEQYGMIACGGGKILKTTDGGDSWLQLLAGDSRALYTIDIIDSTHIITAGVYGKNVYSSDGGTNWVSNIDIPAFSATNWIDFIDTDTGYSVQDITNIKKTTNRGQSWFSPTPNGLSQISEWHIQMLEDGAGYACGEEIGGSYALNFYKRTDGLDNWSRIFLNDNWSDIFFINETQGFIISGGLYKTSDAGITWYRNTSAPGGTDILFIDSLIGFIASDKIYKTTDEGNNWYQTNSLGLGAGKIFFVTKQLGWATSGRSILKTTDSGENWFVQITLPSDSYTSIFFIDSLNGWATSRYIWQTTNGGDNWIQRTDVQLYFNRNIYFTSIDTGFVTVDMTNTGSHDLYKTTNGGISWLRDTRIETAYTIHPFPNKYHWISNGWSMSQVFETTDNGNSWEEISGGLPAIFGQFYSPIEYVGYAVSGYGLILKYFDTTYVPVELTQLTARYSLNKIELNWSTASEVNNYGFEIWKSSDLQYWEKIGFLHGVGTSTEIINYSFSDFKIESDQLYYKIKQIDFDGSNKFSEVVSIKIPINNFVLTQNYPNPANPTTNISFTVPQKGSVKMELFSMTGEKIKEILNEEKERGIYIIEIDLKKYASGVYYYRMTTNSGYTATKKLILIK